MQILSIPTGSIGTNTYLVFNENGRKEGFLVDPGDYSKNISEEIKKLGVDVKYIMLTHGHGDHIMGVPGFKKDFPEAKVVACEKEKEMLNNQHLNMSDAFSNPTEIDADIYVSDDEEMNIDGIDIKFLFTPGHSPGGMCIYIPSENTLFSGDTLFQSSIGRTDFPGCSFEALKESINNKLWPLPDETNVFPGHMGPTNIGFEKENNPFVHI